MTLIERLTEVLSEQGVKRVKERHLLREAYRRKMEFCPEMPLAVAWVGLGTPSKYKSKYFQPIGEETPRAANWYTLSAEGVKVMEIVLKKCPFPAFGAVKNQVNDLLFRLKFQP